jgi:hypothetical protein
MIRTFGIDLTDTIAGSSRSSLLHSSTFLRDSRDPGETLHYLVVAQRQVGLPTRVLARDPPRCVRHYLAAHIRAGISRRFCEHFRSASATFWKHRVTECATFSDLRKNEGSAAMQTEINRYPTLKGTG